MRVGERCSARRGSVFGGGILISVAPDLLIVIPARGGSKRLPGKNLSPLAGRSLLAWTDEAIRESRLNAPCLLSTDDEAIATAGRALGWWVPFLRPRELATDEATTAAAVLHALDWHKAERGIDPEILLLLQVTSPFRRGARLVEAVSLLRSEKDLDAVVSVSALHARPSALYFRDGGGRLRPAATASSDAQLFTPNGAIYAIRTAAFREANAFVTSRTRSLILDGAEAVDIDTSFDWHMAEALAKTWRGHA